METAIVRVRPGPTVVDSLVLRHWPATHRIALLDHVAVRLSQMGEVSAVWFAITALAAATLRVPTRTGVLLGLAIVGEWVVTNRFVKRFVWRPRPNPDGPDRKGVRRPSSSSLPSGHSSASAFAAVLVGAHTGWLLPMAALAVALGCSRFHLRVHYPTDVMAGWAWGGLLGLVVLRAAG